MQLLYRSKEAEELKGMLLKKMLSCPHFNTLKEIKQLPGEGFTSGKLCMVFLKIFEEIRFLGFSEKYHLIPLNG